MRTLTSLTVVYFISVVLAHGGHNHESSGPAKGETIQQYAMRHMAKEHHIDSFDLRSFFQLHDLNRDGVWDREEIEAIYGVHHVYSQKKSKDDEEHQKKADHIVGEVLRIMDANKDGKVTPEEFEAKGLDALPNFDHMGAEGHHYDVESEFFLHHEEEFHSTPETQTDESYVHPEDIEHFAQHEKIEREEAEKEAKYQGISVDEVLAAYDAAAHAAEEHHNDSPQDGSQQPLAAEHPHAEQVEGQAPPGEPSTAPNPRVTRVTPPEKQDPAVRFRNAKAEAEAKGAWGLGEDGYAPPVNPGDRMRKNLPYKYKFRRSWGDF